VITLERDGVHLAGRWSYASGCRHADWFVLGAIADGAHVVALVPAGAVTIVDNWDVLGLRGSGSHDVTVDVDLPTRQLATVFTSTPWSDAPLYRVPLFGALACGVAACALGIAHHALEVGLAREPSTAQLAIWAHAWARVDAARSYLHATMLRATQQAVVSTSPADATTRGELRLAAVHTATECAEVIRALFRLAGGPAIRAGHPLNAALRDVETVLTHRMVSDRVVPAAARAMLGLGTPPADL
jgi:alkylation response protein AidB-like acyl-CoA dehydrogenase